jgi:hypothetical protein
LQTESSESYARQAASNVKKLKRPTATNCDYFEQLFYMDFFIVSACGNIAKNFIKHFPITQCKD